MATAFMGTIGQSYVAPSPAAPLNADPSSGAQKAATQAVVGSDSAATATLPAQPLGGAVVAAGFVVYVPPIPT